MNVSAKPPPPPAKNGLPKPAPSGPATQTKSWPIVGGLKQGAERVVLYGPGGIGKSTLAALAPSPVFLDLEAGTGHMDVQRVEQVENFDHLRKVLQSDALDPFGTIVLDSATMAEEWALKHMLKTVPHEKGNYVNSIEGYGFGKGYTHLYESYMLLLQDLDRHVRQGRNVILIAHDCVTDVPNPVGDDWIRVEPHLQSPKSGKSSIRNRVVQWADHVLYLGYDVSTEGGKGRGSGTRTIYTFELPSHIAKSRTVREALPFTGPEDDSIWTLILNGGQS
jgi:hypothetical protein